MKPDAKPAETSVPGVGSEAGGDHRQAHRYEHAEPEHQRQRVLGQQRRGDAPEHDAGQPAPDRPRQALAVQMGPVPLRDEQGERQHGEDEWRGREGAVDEGEERRREERHAEAGRALDARGARRQHGHEDEGDRAHPDRSPLTGGAR